MANQSEQQKKNNLKYCPETLNSYLGDYMKNFTKDIDQLWNQHDLDHNNYLDKDEARTYVAELYECIIPERKENYDASKFDDTFSKIDTDGNMYLSKAEMSIFIKKLFSIKRSNTNCNKPTTSKTNFIENVQEIDTIKQQIVNLGDKQTTNLIINKQKVEFLSQSVYKVKVLNAVLLAILIYQMFTYLQGIENEPIELNHIDTMKQEPTPKVNPPAPKPEKKKETSSWGSKPKQPVNPDKALFEALEDLNLELKKASTEYFDFNITDESLFTVQNLNQDHDKIIKKYFDIILWIHWKSKSSMNSFYTRKFGKPEAISVEKIQVGSLFGPISKELTCNAGEQPTLSKMSHKTFETLFDQISNDYKQVDNYNQLQAKIKNLKNLVSKKA